VLRAARGRAGHRVANLALEDSSFAPLAGSELENLLEDLTLVPPRE
jgi:hypothetical protein